ncbi:MAG: type II secretion system minor pseudopilin GspK [Aeromonadaceae bacterium]
MRRQRGVALLVVMLILAIMMVVAANISSRFQLELMRTSNLVTLSQGKWYAMAAEALVSKILHQDLKDSPDRVHLAQYWASQGQIFPVEGGTIKGVIHDAQGCFNLNAINSGTQPPDGLPYAADVFKNLLINLKVETFEAEQITAAVRDWIDVDDDLGSSLGAEDAWYQSQKVPYLAANRQMSDISELRLVRGITASIYRRLAPMVCALPNKEMALNVNTLRKEQLPLIGALFLGNMDLEQSKRLLEARPRDGWTSADLFLQEPLVLAANPGGEMKKNIGVKSIYFEAKLEVALDETKVHFTSLFKSNNNKISVISRQYGGSE